MTQLSLSAVYRYVYVIASTKEWKALGEATVC